MKVSSIVRTRSYSVDYRFYSKPSFLSKTDLDLVDNRIKNVMVEESFSIIKDFRYHILRVGNYVLVGVATRKYARVDEYGRPIRSYIGLVLPLSVAAMPKLDVFDRLDNLIVNPHFSDLIEGKDSDVIIELSPDDFYESRADLNIEFNCDILKLQYHSDRKEKHLISFLQAAVATARNHKPFELVYGMNRIYESEKMPIMNVFCYEQKTPFIKYFDKLSRNSASMSLPSVTPLEPVDIISREPLKLRSDTKNKGSFLHNILMFICRMFTCHSDDCQIKDEMELSDAESSTKRKISYVDPWSSEIQDHKESDN